LTKDITEDKGNQRCWRIWKYNCSCRQLCFQCS